MLVVAVAQVVREVVQAAAAAEGSELGHQTIFQDLVP
jgi:hypothetical protein